MTGEYERKEFRRTETVRNPPKNMPKEIKGRKLGVDSRCYC